MNNTIKFFDYCKDGNLDAAKELLKKYPYISDESKTEYAFKWASFNGHMEVVQWLHDIMPSECIIEASRWAASNGNIEISCWLDKQIKQNQNKN